jgi:hypothetical protein
MAIVFILVQTKQIGINTHKQTKTKHSKTIQNTVLRTSTHITKTPTHFSAHTYTPTL